MGSFLLYLLLFLCSTLFIYRFLIKFHNQKSTLVNGKNLQLPPGSKGWPFVGEMLDYIYHNYKGIPEKFIENRKKKYSTKVFKTSLMGDSAAVLCGPEGNKFLFSNEDKLVRVWFPAFIDKIFPKTSNESNAEEFRKNRRMISSFFKINSLRKSVGVMDSVMKQHLQSDWRSGKVKVKSMAEKYTARLSCQIILSINDLKTIDEFSKAIEVINTGMGSLPINLPGTALNRAIKASKAMRKQIEKMIKQRKIDIAERSSSAVPQDMITHILMNTDENGEFLNEFDMASHVLGMMEGATFSLPNTITLIMMHLSEFPDVYDSVLREQIEIAESKEPHNLLTLEDLSRMKYTWNVVCEVLRLFSPVGTFRTVITNFEFAGYRIPKGWKMYWSAHAVHKNPEYFQDPDKFDPTRFQGNGPAPYTFIPFGGGPRMCPGAEYARLALLVFIHNVTTKFKWEKLIPNEKLIHGTTSSPAYGFPIRLHPLKS